MMRAVRYAMASGIPIQYLKALIMAVATIPGTSYLATILSA